ncbi:MAG: hypothetical protein AMXMBFR4_14720 [Candidatus Hydrogenedentota bacterium]
MQCLNTLRFLRFSVVLLLAVSFSMPVLAEFRAGIAVQNVTPDPLIPVSGGAGRPNPADKKVGELEVRALVLERGDTTVAIVSAPYIGFPSVLGNKVRAKVQGIQPENILIGSTHTHSGPDMYAIPLDENGTSLADLGYIEKACDLMAKCIQDARAALQPASVKIAEADAAEKIAYNYYAPNLYDRRCNVMQFIDNSGKAIATLVNYAIHPEVIGPGQGICSPDMVGPLHDRIAEQGGGVGIFMNGAQGGMVTADCRGPDGKDIQTWEECVRIGNLLADEALRIVKDAPVQSDPDLFCAAKMITFPVDAEMMRFIVLKSPLGYEMSEDFKIQTQVNVLNLGTAQVLTIPGEALPNIGYYLKRNMHGEQNFLFGLTNDAFGYILVKEDFKSFKRYDYITRTSLGEQTGPILVEEGLKFVNECPRPAKSS